MASFRERTESYQYDLFLLEEMIESYKMELYLNEALVLEGGDAVQIRLIHEGAMDKIREAFKKLIEMITSLWQKFVYNIGNLMKTDKAYLEKHKDTILKKKLKEESYTMYPYWKGEQKLLSAKVPSFNYATMADELKSDEDFIARHFSAFNKKEGYIEAAKTAFRGSDKQEKIDTMSINMTDIYTFCVEYADTAKKLEADMKQIEKAGNDAITIINRAEKASVSESFGLDRSTTIYSYLLEAPLVQKEPKAPSNSVSKNNQNIEKPSDAPGETKPTAVEGKGEDIDRIKRYIKLCYGFLGAKMAIFQETYQAYMFIIRDHVKSYVGNTKDELKDGSKDKDQGTDRNPQDDEDNSSDAKEMKDVRIVSNNPIRKLMDTAAKKGQEFAAKREAKKKAKADKKANK